MDWAAVASILGERSERPVALLDQEGRIRMFNRAMEQLLGCTRFDVEGQLWSRVCTPSDRADESQRWIDDALRGALGSFEATCLARSGSLLLVRLEFSLVGRGATQGLLLTATQWQQVEPPRPVLANHDLDYDIVTEPPSFGTVVRMAVDAERIHLPHDDMRCFAVIHGLQRPCDNCPALRTDDDSPWPRVFVRHVTQGERTAFEIRSAERTDGGLVRIRTRTLPDHALEAIHTAKIEQLADRAELSVREREVLMYLLLGRTIEDIAMLMGIAVRTVKYHQANILQKLGADSRADLMRLLF